MFGFSAPMNAPASRTIKTGGMRDSHRFFFSFLTAYNESFVTDLKPLRGHMRENPWKLLRTGRPC